MTEQRLYLLGFKLRPDDLIYRLRVACSAAEAKSQLPTLLDVVKEVLQKEVPDIPSEKVEELERLLKNKNWFTEEVKEAWHGHDRYKIHAVPNSQLSGFLKQMDIASLLPERLFLLAFLAPDHHGSWTCADMGIEFEVADKGDPPKCRKDQDCQVLAVEEVTIEGYTIVPVKAAREQSTQS